MINNKINKLFDLGRKIHRFMELVTILLLNRTKKEKYKNSKQKYYVISQYSKKKMKVDKSKRKGDG